jgi:ribosomal protein S18 acetylase RimI-like enzyme
MPPPDHPITQHVVFHAAGAAGAQDDPVSGYFSGHKRRRFVKDEVKGYLKALPGATNFISTPDSLAVALWQLLPQETPANELLAGWTRFLRVPLRLWPSLFRLELHYERAHEQVAGAFGSYYYLSFIGTHPDARGKGYGSLLLKHITDRWGGVQDHGAREMVQHD